MLVRQLTRSLLASLGPRQLTDRGVKSIGIGLDLSGASLFQAGGSFELRLIAALLVKTYELQAANEARASSGWRSPSAGPGSARRKGATGAVGEDVVWPPPSILNPLAVILGALQVLRHPDLAPSEREEALGQAEGEIHKIERVVRGLATLRRVAGTPYIGTAIMVDLARSCRQRSRREAGEDSPTRGTVVFLGLGSKVSCNPFHAPTGFCLLMSQSCEVGTWRTTFIAGSFWLFRRGF